MALPYQMVEFVGAILVGGFVLGWWAAPRIIARRSSTTLDQVDLRRRSRRARTVLSVVAAGVLIGTIGLEAAGAPLGPNDRRLQAGDSWGGDDPRLLALGAGPSPLEQDVFIYAYGPGAEVRTGITLANDGNVPLRVIGLEPSTSPFVRSIEFRLPPEPFPRDVIPVYASNDSTIWASEPFQPFDIPAHGQVALGLAVVLRACPGMGPVPTLGPGASPSTDSSQAAGVGFTAVSEAQVDYTAFGIARTSTVPLQARLFVEARPGDVVSCPSGT